MILRGPTPVRLRALAVFASVVLAPCAAAQSKSYTLEDVLRSLRQAADSANFASVEPNANRILDSLARVLRAGNVTGLSVGAMAAITTRQRAAFATMLRLSPQRYASWPQPWVDSAIVGLEQIANSKLAPALRTPERPPARIKEMLDPFFEFSHNVDSLSRVANKEKLRRYEIKYGPESPRLNFPEVLLNFIAQRFSPFAGGEDGPSPYEIVTRYSTSGLTGLHNERGNFVGRVVSSTHLGIRHYQFGAEWGEGSLAQRLLKPRHFSIGAMSMSILDKALVPPFRGAQRIGGFLDWGSARIGYVSGKNWRVVIGAGKQIIPLLF